MFATTITGNGDEVLAVEEVEVVEEEEDALALLLWLLWPLCTVEIDVTVLVTVLVGPAAGGAAGGAVDGAKRLLATDAMPTVTKTAPRVIATMRKWRRGFAPP